MARDADGRPIRQRPETDGEDENLTEDESSYPRSKTQRRTGHNSKFAPLKGNPSDLNHRQKKVHIMMMLSHIQDSVDFKDDLEKFRRHINENPDRDEDKDEVPLLSECFDSDYLTSMSPGKHDQVMDEWQIGGRSHTRLAPSSG